MAWAQMATRRSKPSPGLLPWHNTGGRWWVSMWVTEVARSLCQNKATFLRKHAKATVPSCTWETGMILSKHSSLLDAFHRCFWAIQEYFISKGFQFVVNAHDKVALMAGARAGLPRKRKRVQTTHVGSLPRPDWLLPILRGEERPPPDYKAKLLEATVDLLWTPEKLWFGPPQNHRNSSESAESHGLRGPRVMPGTLMVPTPWFRRLFAWNEIQDIHLSLSWGRNYAETVGCRFGRDQRWRNGAKSLCHLSSATTVRLGWEPPRNLGEMESCRPAMGRLNDYWWMGLDGDDPFA